LGQTGPVRDENVDTRPSLGVVTGASSGFGLEVARTLVKREWEVITISRSRSAQLDEIASVTQVCGDITSMDFSDLTEAVSGRPVDLLVNNAGVGATGMRLESLAAEELQRSFAVNVVGPARVAQALLPHLLRSSHPLVVNVSSRLASLSRQAAGSYAHVPTSYAYRITKAAQNMLTVCMATELGPAVRVWAIHPGRLRTAMGLPDADGDPAEAAERLVSLISHDTVTQLAYVALDEGPLPW
jgi:NAD(P)-dependent dehydrogenase (short-subunit alcohol dehydrogenase family)